MAILIFALSACGSEQDSADDSNIRTLSFLSSSEHVAVARQAARSMNASWYERGYPYEFVLDVDFFPFAMSWEEAEAHYTRLMIQLMAGQGPDVFIFDRGFDVPALARSGFLVDFYTLIDNCPHTSREDFFTQALDAFEIQGGLYMLPVNFVFNYVAINTNLPQSIIDRFTHHELITIEQMIEIYLALLENYPGEFGHMYFALSNSLGGGFGPRCILPHIMGSFVDFETRTSDLTNPEFVSFLENYFKISEDRHIFSNLNYVHGWISRDIQSTHSSDYVFAIHASADGQAHSFFTPYEPIFSHTRLLSNSEGKLITNSPVWQAVMATIGVTAAGDNDLAWEFIRYLLRAYIAGVSDPSASVIGRFGDNYFGTPIMRELHEFHAPRALNRFLNENLHSWGANRNLYVGMGDPAERTRQVENAVQRLSVYNEMPMTMLHSMIPRRLVTSNLDLFMRGLITSQEFAQRTQNAVSLWLIE